MARSGGVRCDAVRCDAVRYGEVWSGSSGEVGSDGMRFGVM